jgi:hypothetical protein
MDRLVATNERYLGTRLRLVVLPCPVDITADALVSQDRTLTVAIPNVSSQEPIPAGEGQAPPPGVDVILPAAAYQGCTCYEVWGCSAVERTTAISSLVFLLIWKGPEADAAAADFRCLAAESGRLYQTLPPTLAPISGTTSPRNLWATALYGWLSRTPYVSDGVGFEVIGLPFAASAELWRRLLYGTTAEGKVEPGEHPPPAAATGAEPVPPLGQGHPAGVSLQTVPGAQANKPREAAPRGEPLARIALHDVEALPATLEALCDWLAGRVRWLRSWHLAPEPKLLASGLIDAVVRMFGNTPPGLPPDVAQIPSWASQHIWLFSERTIHQAHACLERLGIFSAPAWCAPDPEKSSRVLIHSLNHLTALLSFVAKTLAADGGNPGLPPPSPLPPQDLNLWEQLRVAFTDLVACMQARPDGRLDEASDYQQQLVQSLRGVGMALEVLGLQDCVDRRHCPPGHASSARTLLQLTHEPTIEAVRALLAQDGREPALFDLMRRDIHQFADSLLTTVRPRSESLLCPVGPGAQGTPTPPANTAPGRAPGPKCTAHLRSWTQDELEDAIRQYKARHAAQYRDVAEGVRQGLPGAEKAARELFGRNAIARALGVKARAMVTKSTAWQEIAADLQLSRKVKAQPRLTRGKRIGLTIAVEEVAPQYTGKTNGLDRAVHNETISLLRQVMSEKEAEKTIDKLERGLMTDDEARELVDLCRQQQQDARARRVRRSP